MPADKLERYWTEQSNLIRAILQRGGFTTFIQGQPNQNDIWQLPNTVLGCIDEGCSATSHHLAGSGILLGMDQCATVLKDSGVTEITSHDGCGAASLYAKREHLDLAKADNYGIVFAQKLAEKTGLSYRHITAQEMSRPPEFHIARLAVYDGSGNFNPAAIPGFPACFWISRYLNPEAKEEAAISAQIALGGHGYGNLITPEEPFYFIIIGHPSNPALSVRALLNELSSIFEQPGRISLVSLTPKK
ncbi:MAG: hypothetical protein WC497_03490 [Patescibacteria group bacterium]